MPLMFQPSKTFDVELSTGGRFTFRALTGAELMDFCDANDRAEQLRQEGPGGGRKLVQQTYDSITRCLVAWEIDAPAELPTHLKAAGFTVANGKLEFLPDKLSSLLAIEEATELLGGLVKANAIGAAERGKSSPASDSPSASPAPVAATGNA